ncbi:MAG: Gamma-glutamyl phosphate reductase [Sodalis sp.]|nr:MAG: Gamma-glutamyl phosphate reductase [Sodalis sp.]
MKLAPINHRCHGAALETGNAVICAAVRKPTVLVPPRYKGHTAGADGLTRPYLSDGLATCVAVTEADYHDAWLSRDSDVKLVVSSQWTTSTGRWNIFVITEPSISDAILTQSVQTAEHFVREVGFSAVYVNARNCLPTANGWATATTSAAMSTATVSRPTKPRLSRSSQLTLENTPAIHASSLAMLTHAAERHEALRLWRWRICCRGRDLLEKVRYCNC